MKEKNRAWKRGSASLLAVLLLVAVLTGLCILGDRLELRYGWRRDYSFNSVTTYSEKTGEILASLKYPVHIYALFSRDNEDRPLMELLNRYSAGSDMVSWETADLSLNPSLITRFRGSTSSEVVSSDSLIVSCEQTGRFRILDPSDFVSLNYDPEAGVYEMAGVTYESSLTQAIQYVTMDVIPRIMILQGQGELDENGTEILASLLVSNQYEVNYFTLDAQEAELEKGDLLMILSPVRDFTDAEFQKIRTFILKGGSVFITCDYTDPVENMPNMQALLRYYGVQPLEGIVIASDEEPQTYYEGRQLILIPYMQSTAITREMVENHSNTLLLAGSRAFEMPGAGDRDLSVAATLTSGSRAWLRSLDGDLSTLEQQAEDRPGPFALALEAERLTENSEMSRAFILGCSTVLTSADLYVMTDSQEMILRTVQYLLGDERETLNIPARLALRPKLGVGALTLGRVLWILLPVSIALAACLVLIPRRRRH